MYTPPIIYEWARSYVATDGGTITWPERLKMAWIEYKARKRKRCKVRATYVTKVNTDRYKMREKFRINAFGAFHQCKARPQLRRKGKLSNKHVEQALKREHEARTQVYAQS